jgi:hypothetical protein
MQEALNLAGNYAIEMSKPIGSDKSVEESVTKSCCGGKDRQHNNENHQHVKEDNNIPKNAGKYYCPMHCEELKYMTKQAIVLFAEWIW